MGDTPNTITDSLGNNYTVGKKLSSGGQGIACRIEGHPDLLVKFRYGNKKTLALEFKSKKFYNQNKETITHLMSLPQIERLTMPITLISKPYCGYLMRFMGGMESLNNFLVRYSTNSTLDYHGKLQKKKILILKSLADLLDTIHRKGMVYRDLSPNNIFIPIDEDKYNTWLIDVDNLDYANIFTQQIGTPRYIAPEIKKGGVNTIYSDCYSFALIAFEVLTGNKPFDGSASENEDDDWDVVSNSDTFEEKCDRGEIDYILEPGTTNKRIYGLSPDFCMTEKMKELFLQTLSKEGRSAPYTRPSMNEWRIALNEAANLLAMCDFGHYHFDNKCPFCLNIDPSLNKFKYYTLTMFKSVPVADEKDKKQKIIYLPANSYRFSLNPEIKSEITLSIDVGTGSDAPLLVSHNKEKFTVSIGFPYKTKNKKGKDKSKTEFFICDMRGNPETELFLCEIKEDL